MTKYINNTEPIANNKSPGTFTWFSFKTEPKHDVSTDSINKNIFFFIWIIIYKVFTPQYTTDVRAGSGLAYHARQPMKPSQISSYA